MDSHLAAASVIAASARANARVNGMLAENSVRWRSGLPIAFGHQDFIDVIDQEGISRDAILAILTHGSMNRPLPDEDPPAQARNASASGSQASANSAT